MSSISMQVIKRNGKKENVSFDKVLNRIQAVSDGLEVNAALIAQRTLARIYDGVKTSELDELAAQLSISLMTTHPDYGLLGSRIIISNHQRNTPTNFTEVIHQLTNQIHEKTGKPINYISDDLVQTVNQFGDAINRKIVHERDFLLDYFGFKTLEKQKYLLRSSTGIVLERPQHMWMRVALALWGEKARKLKEENPSLKDEEALESAFQTYDLVSQKYFIHATPTNYNAGTPRSQLSSCYLIAMEDSISGIYKTLSDCAQISKYAGGIGVHIHDIRARGAHIAGNGGTSTGIVPMLRNFNATARYVDQGSKRNGSFAIYLEPWHADIEDFLKLKLNTGTEEERARDLFYAIWMTDLFMERVEKNEKWTLFCPSEAPGLADVYGPDFKQLYEKYESEGLGRKQIDAQKLWFKILDSQIETGTPYIVYKDAANLKSNQKNLGTIRSSNLCVAPETTILTKEGNRRISDLKDKEVDVWNGDQWSRVTVKQTGTRQKLIKVIIEYTSSVRPFQSVLYCTPYHKFILPTHDAIADCERIEAKDLKSGMTLKVWKDRTNTSYEMRVVLAEDYGRYDDTYCFTEPLNQAGVFNGILTGNCSEIIEYSDKDETAVCNLASICLPTYVNIKSKSFNFQKLREVTHVAITNLNRVIDINFYPTPETHRSNMRHRPVGLGVQGLADVFALLRLPWESKAAAELNQRIFEHMYYASVEASADEAERDGRYETYEGSPMSKGQFQFDMWSTEDGKPITPLTAKDNTLDWNKLRERVAQVGQRNSLLIAPMPTASTSQIMGNNETFEPITSNIYTRRTLSGVYTVINKYLMRDLMKLQLWNEDMKQRIIIGKGSIQHIEEIPEKIKELYKTAWEIKQRTLIDMSADRGAFVCQSQSLNLFIADPNYAKLTSMHFYGWKKGLKTGIYYLRTKPPVDAQMFTVDPELQAQVLADMKKREESAYSTEGCTMCSA